MTTITYSSIVCISSIIYELSYQTRQDLSLDLAIPCSSYALAVCSISAYNEGTQIKRQDQLTCKLGAQFGSYS